MTRWAAFVGVTGVVLFFVLLLARASQAYVDGDPSGDHRRDRYPRRDADEAGGPPREAPRDSLVGEPPASVSPDPTTAGNATRSDGDVAGRPTPGVRNRGSPADSPETGHGSGPPGPGRRGRDRDLGLGDPPSKASLLANVTVSQGVFLAILVASAYLAAIPPAALGLDGIGPGELAVGTGLGVALYLANEVGAGLADRVGIGHDEGLRELLAPDSTAGWVLLLVVVLPVIAGFEELLFRAALVGVVPAGYGVSPWVMVGFSSVAFGIGHGAQGPAGIAVTGALGAVLAAAFVLTGSLLAVVVAHYLVNALEFVVHEGLDRDPAAVVGP